jgi:arylsulfatase A-like enzyme
VGDNDLTRDTIIIFLSDHGHSVEADTMGGGGRSAPFRGGKTTLWEGGIRVPCIVAWPGTLPRGQVRQQPVMNIDLLPTIAEWCGVPLLGLEVDGRSLQPVIDSPMSESPHEFLAWTWQKWSAVRSGPWKYVQDNENTQYLYNLATDPGESSNLIRSHADTARRLIAHRDSWFSELRRNPRTHVWLP